jgi:hypothetical protein
MMQFSLQREAFQTKMMKIGQATLNGIGKGLVFPFAEWSEVGRFFAVNA